MQTSLQRCGMPHTRSSQHVSKHACSSAGAGGRGAPALGFSLAVRRDVRTCFRVSDPADTQDKDNHPRQIAPVQQAQDPEHPQQQQQHLHPPNPFPLKYAQMGHSRFGRGAPHVCYSQVGDSGVFYIKPEVDELLDDWQQWLEQQQRQHQQRWQQRRQQLQAWARAQNSGSRQVPLPGWGFCSADAAALPSHDAANAASANSSGGTSAGNDAASDDKADKQSLLDSMLSSTAAGGIGVIAALAAAAAAAFKIGNSSGGGSGSSGGGGGGSSSGGGGGGQLHAAGPGLLARAQHLLLGMSVGMVGFVLMMLYCKSVLAALLLCYAGFVFGM